jgi:hypothetical protein
VPAENEEMPMSYTRRQYVLMAVLALGLGVLGFDLLFMHSGDLPPQSAQAQTAGQSDEFTVPQSAGPASGEEPRYAMAHKVREFAAAEVPATQPSADAFVPSGDWMAELRKKPVELYPTQAMAQGFMDHHRLSSTMCLPGQSSAIVDQQILRVGAMVDGFRLESIKPTCVVFSREDLNIVLTIKQDAAKE